MADTSQQLIDAIEAFDALADGVTPDAAYGELDEATLQIFWREWPQISAWAGSLWRKVNQDLVEPASPESEGLSDTGGSG